MDRSLGFELDRVRNKLPDAHLFAESPSCPGGGLAVPGDGVRSMEGFWPVLIMIGLGAGFAGGNIVLSQFLGPSKPSPEKSAPYECGIPAVGDARERQSVKF